MSRIGKLPVKILDKVTVNVDGDNVVTVKGPKGELKKQFNKAMKIEIDGTEVKVSRPNDEKQNRALHGLTRTLINNMVIGVTDGYQKVLEINGVGYKVEKQEKKLVL